MTTEMSSVTVKTTANAKTPWRWPRKSSIRTGVIQHQSTDDEVSGRDPGLQVRTEHGEHVVASRAEGEGDMSGDIVPHSVQDTDDRSFQTIRPSEGDHQNAIVNLGVELGKVAVSGIQAEGEFDVFGGKVELAT
jgi:hypothetical protein